LVPVRPGQIRRKRKTVWGLKAWVFYARQHYGCGKSQKQSPRVTNADSRPTPVHHTILVIISTRSSLSISRKLGFIIVIIGMIGKRLKPGGRGEQKGRGALTRIFHEKMANHLQKGRQGFYVNRQFYGIIE
jgi:hypothetical protein